MRGDFSLLRPDLSDYSLVLMQQGRILVDSDWNAAMATLISAQRTLAADLIGPHGGPSVGGGFQVSLTGDGSDLALTPGVYYVDGIRCELRRDLLKEGATVLPFKEQPYAVDIPPPEFIGEPCLAYLDVWERHVSALEDDSIREVALGGPDTTSRRQIVWQVRVVSYPTGGGAKPTCAKFDLDPWRADRRGNPPKLRARPGPPTDNHDPCLASPDARYRGVENQLYRVEIAEVKADGQTLFVWSRENGSVAAAWTATEGNHLHVVGIRDGKHGFAPDDWVELTWDTIEFAGHPGTRVRLTGVDGPVLTFDPDSADGLPIEPKPEKKPHAKVRRWDQRGRKAAPLTRGAVQVVEGSGEEGWIELEDGIQVQFAASSNGPYTYRVGDYWTIPARVATGDIVWPPDADGKSYKAIPPHGIVHHYAPLAWVGTDNKVVPLQMVFTTQAKC